MTMSKQYFPDAIFCQVILGENGNGIYHNKFYNSGMNISMFSSISGYFPNIKLEQTTIYSVLITSGQDEGDVTRQETIREGPRITVSICSNDRIYWPELN